MYLAKHCNNHILGLSSSIEREVTVDIEVMHMHATIVTCKYFQRYTPILSSHGNITVVPVHRHVH